VFGTTTNTTKEDMSRRRGKSDTTPAKAAAIKYGRIRYLERVIQRHEADLSRRVAALSIEQRAEYAKLTLETDQRYAELDERKEKRNEAERKDGKPSSIGEG
jgi:hypothetical protein